MERPVDIALDAINEAIKAVANGGIYVEFDMKEYIKRILQNLEGDIIYENFSRTLTPEQEAQQRDEDKARFVERNFAAVYAQQMIDNRELGYSKENGFVIRDWQRLIEDTIAALEFAFDKINFANLE